MNVTIPNSTYSSEQHLKLQGLTMIFYSMLAQGYLGGNGAANMAGTRTGKAPVNNCYGSY